MRVNYEAALDDTCRLHSIPRAVLLSRSPNRQAVKARQDLIRTLIRGGWTYSGIAVIMRCHHTTILNALKGKAR